MFKLLGCAQGHFWEVGDGETPPPVCPVCGATSLTESGPDLAPSDSPPAAESPAAPPPPPPLLDARGRPVVAGYEILEEQGRGPTGVPIYKARQTLIQRPVTLKVVVAREDPGQLAWTGLRGEASALGRLHHPNIIALLEAGERDRQLFFNVLEHVDGPTLAGRIDGKLPPTQAAALVEVLADAVESAHRLELLHRCLKPASVLLQPVSLPPGDRPVPTGTCRLQKDWFVPKLTDFGLARKPLEGETADIELQGAMPSYLAPEQAAGRVKDIGPATDVYGLGAILYELLTGRPPFRGSTPGATVAQIQNAELIPPSRLRPLPADLDAICRKALHHSPRRRYPSAAVLAEELRRFRLGRPVEARPAGALRKAGLWMARNRLASGLVASLLLALAVFLSALVYAGAVNRSVADRVREQFRQDLTVQQDLERRNAALEQQQRAQGAIAQRIEGYRHAVRLRDIQDTLRAGGKLDEAKNLLEAVPAAQRQWEVRYLSMLARDEKPAVRILEAGSSVKALAFSPEGRTLAVVGGNLSKPGDWGFQDSGILRVYNLPSTRLVLNQVTNGTVWDVAFSPDGSRLATAANNRDRAGTLAVWAVAGLEGRPTPLLAQKDFSSPLTGVAFVPTAGEQRLAVRTAGGRAFQLQLRQNPVGFEQPEAYEGREAGSSPGRVVALGTTGGLAWLGSGGIVQIFNQPETPIYLAAPEPNETLGPLAASADGKRLAVGLESFFAIADPSENCIGVWTAPWTSPPTVLQGPPSCRACALAFSPDGRRLFAACADASLRVWDPQVEVPLLHVALADLFPNRDLAGLTALAVSRDADQVAVAAGSSVYLIGPLPRLPAGR